LATSGSFESLYSIRNELERVLDRNSAIVTSLISSQSGVPSTEFRRNRVRLWMEITLTSPTL